MYPPVPLLLLVPVFVPAAAAAVAAAINTILCRGCWQGWWPREPRQLLVSSTPPTLLGTLFIVTVPVTTPAHTSRAMPSVINCLCLIAGLEIGLPKVWRAKREAASQHALHRHYRLHGACTHKDDDAAALQPIMPPSGPWLLAPVTGQQDHAHSGDAQHVSACHPVRPHSAQSAFLIQTWARKYTAAGTIMVAGCKAHDLSSEPIPTLRSECGLRLDKLASSR